MSDFKPIPLTETQMAELFRLREENAEQQKRIDELESERDIEIARNRPLRSLISSLEEQKSIWNKRRTEHTEAVKTIDSEREANALITDQLTAAKAQIKALRDDVERCYKMLLSEPDTQGALFKAENILREALAQTEWGADVTKN